MQVHLDTQNNHQTNFRVLKKIEGARLLNYLTGEGDEMVGQIKKNLMEKESFKRLCKNHDVFVNVEPIAIPSGMLAYKGMLMEIYARKIKKWRFLELFKKNPIEPVYTCSTDYELEARTWDSIYEIIENFIKPEEKMDKVINNFIDKTANAAK